MATPIKMDMNSLLLFVALVLVPNVFAQNPTVRVAEGELMGKTVRFSENEFLNVDKDIDLYLGVPFADPPQRFKPPVAKGAWNGTLNVTEFQSACIQVPGFPVDSTDEDCLYLNVYSPSPKPTNAAVMVWIHGGGFVSGTAMTYAYYGVPLAAVGDVIVVSINYRLGVFAKLTTKDAEAPGNIGMLDQVAALQWIHDNIQAFGGDNNRITLFGESAGGASVDFHTLSKLSRDLFSQAIMESGSVFPYWAFDRNPPESEVQNANNLGLALDCDVSSSSSLISCLETKTALQILGASIPTYFLAPVSLDGYFLEDTPTNLYNNGDFKRCPILTGTNMDEGFINIPAALPPSGYDDLGRPMLPFVNLTMVEDLIRSNLMLIGVTEEILIDAILQEYIDWTTAEDPAVNNILSFSEVMGDYGFACPSDRVTRSHAVVGDQVFKYFMTHVPSRSIYEDIQGPQWFGAGHGEELIFVFGMPFIEQLSDIGIYQLTDEEKVLSAKVMKLWTNFVKSGDPSKSSADADQGEGQDSWTPYTIPELYYKEISLDLGEGRALKARQCRFWNYFFPKLQEFVASLDSDLVDWKDDFANWQTRLADWQVAFDKYKDSSTCN